MSMPDPIEAVAESADFGPAYEGESFVTVTLRVPRQTTFGPGLYSLEWKSIDKPAWSRAVDERAYAKRREASDDRCR